MKSILLSIKPKYVELIASGQKTIEVRKTAPKEVPFKCYIYESRNGGHRCKHCNEKDSCYSYAPKNVGCYNGRGRVIGEFVCDKVDKYTFSHYEAEYRVTHVEQNAMCLNQPELIHYGKGNPLYGWHISDLKIYDKPKELWDFVHRKKYDWWDYGHHTNKPQYEWEYISRPPQSWQYVKEREK